jgi:hypothetical protein
LSSLSGLQPSPSVRPAPKPPPPFGATEGLAAEPPTGTPLPIPLTVVNREAVTKLGEPVTSGVPFARWALPSADAVRLLPDGVEIPSQVLPTASWPDGSVRWLLLDVQVDLPASGTVGLTLQTGSAAAPVTGITLDDQPATLTAATGAVQELLEGVRQ